MTLRPFLPWFELLENKLLLAMLPAPATKVMEHAEAPASDIADVSQADRSAVRFSTERHGATTVLLAHFDSYEPGRMLQIVGGDSAQIQPDGTARLNLPADVRQIELTIGDEQVETRSILRLEISEDGRIVSQSSLDDSWQSLSGNGSGLVIAMDHSNPHFANVAGLLFAGPTNWTHGPDMSWETHGEVSHQSVDEAIAHDFGMPMTAAATAHRSSEAGYSQRNHSDLAGDSPNIDEFASEDNSTHGGSAEAQVTNIAAVSAAGSSVIPTTEVESFETVVAGWTAGQEVDSAVAQRIDILIPTPRPDMSPSELAMAEPLLDPGPIVMTSFYAGIEPAMPSVESTETSNWPFVVAILVTVVSATGAIVLERRALAVALECGDASPLSIPSIATATMNGANEANETNRVNRTSEASSL